MNFMALADSFEAVTGTIEYGVDEIYLGLGNENFVNPNLSGRGRGCNVLTISELKRGHKSFRMKNRPLKRCSEMLEAHP